MQMKPFRKVDKTSKRGFLIPVHCWGYTGEDSVLFKKESVNPTALKAEIAVNQGQYNITGKVIDTAGKPVPGVLIKLQMILPQDSTDNDLELAETCIKKLCKNEYGGLFCFPKITG
jgi:hypothetical protein